MTHSSSARPGGRAHPPTPGAFVCQRLRTPFGRHCTAAEVIEGVDLSGQRAIVTGAGSGIGTEAARALASAGADVTLAVRRPQAAGPIAAGITDSTGNAKVSV